ncbi:hypothetical protein ONS95_000597 [Cadophora gregata]|uniref:uncharacterized protein n=1 Tax=Cadophora gregata TaxID=51156 RepID=UPI0026DA7725|nr:uncharacterized protein ONS95_000597 [Cadophora gregata]KAK0125383.1 hypothetical protein ONS96_009230 [Cadophora gregata f. sp. sojae]KAK0128637.1 hypothetical protein ONS95_000597 [Cadophora gregata]
MYTDGDHGPQNERSSCNFIDSQDAHLGTAAPLSLLWNQAVSSVFRIRLIAIVSKGSGAGILIWCRGRRCWGTFKDTPLKDESEGVKTIMGEQRRPDACAH